MLKQCDVTMGMGGGGGRGTRAIAPPVIQVKRPCETTAVISNLFVYEPGFSLMKIEAPGEKLSSLLPANYTV